MGIFGSSRRGLSHRLLRCRFRIAHGEVDQQGDNSNHGGTDEDAREHGAAPRGSAIGRRLPGFVQLVLFDGFHLGRCDLGLLLLESIELHESPGGRVLEGVALGLAQIVLIGCSQPPIEVIPPVLQVSDLEGNVACFCFFLRRLLAKSEGQPDARRQTHRQHQQARRPSHLIHDATSRLTRSR